VAVLDSFKGQGGILWREVTQPKDHLQGVTVDLADGDRESVFVLYAVRAQLSIQTILEKYK